MRRLQMLIMGFIASFSLWAQQRPIQGKITDASGNPLAGVTVSARGTNTATQTAADGTFTINAAQGNILVVSSVGYLLQEIPVGTSNNLNITLQKSKQETYRSSNSLRYQAYRQAARVF